MKSEVKDKVDDLIVGLSNHIQKGIENGYLDMEKEIAEPVKALADLMVARTLASGTISREEKKLGRDVTDRKIELLHKIFDEEERRRALELVAEDKIKAGEYEEANKVLKSIDDNIIKDLRQQLDELEKE